MFFYERTSGLVSEFAGVVEELTDYKDEMFLFGASGKREQAASCFDASFWDIAKAALVLEAHQLVGELSVSDGGMWFEQHEHLLEPRTSKVQVFGGPLPSFFFGFLGDRLWGLMCGWRGSWRRMGSSERRCSMWWVRTMGYVLCLRCPWCRG